MSRCPDDARITALVHAYLAASYRCRCGSCWHAVRIGASAPAIERRFAQAGEFGLVSAWNPRSEPRPQAINEAADRALQAALSQAGTATCRSLAAAPDGSRRAHAWQEPGWLAAGLARAELDALARRFGQLGVLHWRRGQPVRLRIHHPRPAGWDGAAVVDWVE